MLSVVRACAAILAIIVPAAKATAQTQPTTEVKTVLLIHGAWADGSSRSKVIPLLEAKGLQNATYRSLISPNSLDAIDSMKKSANDERLPELSLG